MRVAVAYGDDGAIFEHFGKTQQFKIYDVQDGVVTGTQMLPAAAAGHQAMASLLLANRVDTLICGGIGAGAEMALMMAGIIYYAGAKGNADDAVNAMIGGKLGKNEGVCCDRHTACSGNCTACAGCHEE